MTLTACPLKPLCNKPFTETLKRSLRVSHLDINVKKLSLYIQVLRIARLVKTNSSDGQIQIVI